MVTKLGQKPRAQEKSLLQEDWSILRLRPNAVSSGVMAMQFESLRHPFVILLSVPMALTLADDVLARPEHLDGAFADDHHDREAGIVIHH